MDTRQLAHLSDLVFNQPHLIEPSRAEVIVGVLLNARDRKGEELRAEYEAAATTERRRRPGDFQVLPNGIGVIPVLNTLVHRHSWLSSASGLCSYAAISEMFAAALRDDSVTQILFHMDTPGGTAKGCFDLVKQIRAGRGRKPILALADGMMTSAGYAIGSAADRIIASESSMIGSIGVLMAHADRSAFLNAEGITVTYFKSGKEKDVGADTRPLSDYDREVFQARVDKLAGMFFDEVHASRDRLSVEAIRDMEAGIFFGQDALDMGLIDSLSTYQDTLETLCDAPFGSWDDSPLLAPPTPDKGDEDMTEEQRTMLIKKHNLPENYTAEQVMAHLVADAPPVPTTAPAPAPAPPTPQNDDTPRKTMALKMGLPEDATWEQIYAAPDPNAERLQALEGRFAQQEQERFIEQAITNGQLSVAERDTWFGKLDFETQKSIIAERPAGSVVPLHTSPPAAQDPAEEEAHLESLLTAEQRETNRQLGLSDTDFVKFNKGKGPMAYYDKHRTENPEPA